MVVLASGFQTGRRLPVEVLPDLTKPICQYLKRQCVALGLKRLVEIRFIVPVELFYVFFRLGIVTKPIEKVNKVLVRLTIDFLKFYKDRRGFFQCLRFKKIR